MKIQKYQFFDQILELHSDHEETLMMMDTLFQGFAVMNHENNDNFLKYEVLTKVGQSARVITKECCYLVEQLNWLPSLAQCIILQNTLTQIRSHLLFHAAALSYHNKGIILAADSGCGKTTLALALVQQGFQFLSDDVAALGLRQGDLAPYPRSLLVREGTFHVFQQWGWEWPTHQVALKTADRAVIHLSPTLLGNSCQPCCLIILQRPDQADNRICEVTLDALPERLWKALLTLGIPYQHKIKKGFPVLNVKETLMTQVHEICERQGILVLDVSEQAVATSYYDKTPQLQEISKLTAAVTLLQYYLGHSRSALIQEQFQGNVINLIEPLTNILKPVKCYQLTPGRLDQMVEIIHALCES